ncbi:MAG: superoxide dismutase family protein [Candidatus Enterenecus sp.]
MRIPLGRPEAAACLTGGPEAPELSGSVYFYSTPGGVLVAADIRGLPRSDACRFFAFHIHEGGDCGGEGFAHTGGHFNPTGADHPEHAGDLPPLLGCGGRAFLAALTDQFRVRDILGRTVVIHSHSDDFHTQPSGNAGSKIACGVIRRV